MKETIDYIIRFLLGEENARHADLVGYTSDKEKFSRYKLVIVPSGFFDEKVYSAEKSIPALPLEPWEGIPLLFGKPNVESWEGVLILHADILASTFFLISRYEEFVNRTDRDEHGRFPGRKSLPFRAGFLERPIVDEYGKALRELLRGAGLDMSEPPEKFHKIYLTHDADLIAHYRNFRGMSGAVSRFFTSPRQAFKAIQSYLFGIHHDPWYTFPWLFGLARELKEAQPNLSVESVVFVKSGGGNTVEDKPLHDVRSDDFKKLYALARANGAGIGLHPSYQAGGDATFIGKEKKILDEATRRQTAYSRNHFLRNREPEDFEALINAGLTDDFTMAYADVAGFRLGTCRAVRWINPATRELTPFTLHGTTLMDSTLSDKRYMHLNVDEAFAFSKKMIDQVRTYNGDLVLLWHNNAVEKRGQNYHRDLYCWMINYLKQS